MTDLVKNTVRISPGNAQHIGARGEQQDSFGFSAFDDAEHVEHAGVLSVVADGMGGLAMGKDAGAVAVNTFLNTYMEKTPAEKISTALDRSLHAANSAVNKMAKDAGLEGEVGTTLVAVVIHEGLLYRVAAGDSRIYLFREGQLRQLTIDYNYGRVLDRMVEKGEMKKSEAESHPSRAALTSFLGTAELVEYDNPEDPPLLLLPGDKILLASDGLFGFLPETERGELMAGEPQRAAENMVNKTLALQRPYQDNITVAVLGYDLPARPPLPDTQTRKIEEKQPVTQKKSAKSVAGKWMKVTVAFIVLAVLGFVGGQYFARQSGVLIEPPGINDKNPAKPEKKAIEKPLEKQTEKVPEKPDGDIPSKVAPAPEKQ